MWVHTFTLAPRVFEICGILGALLKQPVFAITDWEWLQILRQSEPYRVWMCKMASTAEAIPKAGKRPQDSRSSMVRTLETFSDVCSHYRMALTLYTKIFILCTWHSIAKLKWRRTNEIWLTMFSCFLTPFRERTVKMWSALFHTSIQEDVESPLFLFKMARGLWLKDKRSTIWQLVRLFSGLNSDGDGYFVSAVTYRKICSPSCAYSRFRV